MLEHGGKLGRAAARYGIPMEDWLDLSTGVNPHAWPVPPQPESSWTRLPEPADGLLDAARGYYGAGSLLPVAGSQAAIQALPALRPSSRVGILTPAYAEHAHAWRRAGHELVPLAFHEVAKSVSSVEVLVLVNPNNPTAERFARDALLAWRGRLAAKGGWLVVDEAFMDPTPGDSLAPFTPLPGLIVLRSLGKFFGLAGARVGFVLAEPTLLEGLEDHLGPWSVAGPSRHVATLALGDRRWQGNMRPTLAADARRLGQLLSRHGLMPAGHTGLFQWVRTPQAPQIHELLARRGILTRLFAEPASLRFGLPAGEPHWRRLDGALAAACEEMRLDTPRSLVREAPR